MSVCLEHKTLLDEMASYSRADKGDPVNQDHLLDPNDNFFITEAVEDKPLNIYFDRWSLLSFLVQMEEENLFLINHVGEEESNLDDAWKRMD